MAAARRSVFSLATDPDGRRTHLALRIDDEATVRRGHEFATARGAAILHGPRLWPQYAPDCYAVFIRDPAGNDAELNANPQRNGQNVLDVTHHSRQDPCSPTDPDSRGNTAGLF